MPIAVTEDHESLRTTVLRWAQTHSPPTVPREVAEAPPGSGDLPAAWEKMATQGWLGLHLPEDQGGQGFTLSELAVVLEELGHALFPGPLLPTVLVSAALARVPRGPATVPPEWLPRPGGRFHHGRRGPGRGRAALAAGGERGAGPVRHRAPGARAPDGTTGPGAARRRHRWAGWMPARPGGAGRRRLGRGTARTRRHPARGTAALRRRRPDGPRASRCWSPTRTSAAWP